jgi:glutamyl-tRNA synthetase
VSEDIETLAYKYALQNAVRYGGKATEGPVVSKVFGERPDLRQRAKEVVEIVKKVVQKVNSMSLEEQRKELETKFPELLEEKKVEEKKGLPPLPGVKEGSLVVRFAPNPDGPLHLGNARAAVINDEYAKMYKGKFILRFDDTDPKVKVPIREAYDWIREDLKWLGVTVHEEIRASARLEIYYEYARKLIELGGAYVDTCTEEEFRQMRSKRKPCPNREKSSEENLELFDKMLSSPLDFSQFGGRKPVVRIKTDLNSPDPSLVDWVILRVVEDPKHPLVNDKYIWPTYNFASAIDDKLTGTTHIFRGKEHEQNTEKQKWVYKYFGWTYPQVYSMGRLKLEGFMMSKSKIRLMLEKGSERDDPRLPTLAGLRRRGILPETIRELLIQIGVKPNDVTVSFMNLAAINRKILDPIAKRLMFVSKPAEYKVDLSELGVRELVARLPLRPNSSEYREIRVSHGDGILLEESDAKDFKRLRLVELCNAEIDNASRSIVCKSLDVQEAKKASLPIVQWVKASEAVPVRLYRILGTENYEVISGKGEAEFKELKENEIIQLIRVGFSRVDEVSQSEVTLIFSHE